MISSSPPSPSERKSHAAESSAKSPPEDLYIPPMSGRLPGAEEIAPEPLSNTVPKSEIEEDETEPQFTRVLSEEEEQNLKLKDFHGYLRYKRQLEQGAEAGMPAEEKKTVARDRVAERVLDYLENKEEANEAE